MNCIPAKVKAIHICTGSGKSVTELVLPVLKQMAGKEMRLRFNLHMSTDGYKVHSWFYTVTLFVSSLLPLFLFELTRRALITKSWLVWRTLVWVRSTAEQFMEGDVGISNCMKRGLESDWQPSKRLRIVIERSQ
jgi:hypothetical protein